MPESIRDPQVVVGAALIRHGQLLAARRKLPASLAGGWELPGGKVEAGESEESALIRECREELGVEIKVGHRVGPETRVSNGYVLRVWSAEVVRGDPRPLEDHDVLRWLSAEDLYDVDWLDADQPVVDELRHGLLEGSPLVGGNVGGAVRIGDTVRRPTGTWTPAVHDLLKHLASVGLDRVPRVLGIDELGREILTYLPGTTVGDGEWPSWAWSDTLLEQTMAWLRRYHDAVAGWRPPPGARWRSGIEWRPGLIICHNDVAPYNLVVDPGGLVLSGVLDWDVAGPGCALDDVAFAAWNFVPLRPMGAHQPGQNEQRRRLELLASAYGEPADAVLNAVVPRMRAAVARIERAAAAGDQGMQRLVASGEVADQRKWVDAFERTGWE